MRGETLRGEAWGGTRGRGRRRGGYGRGNGRTAEEVRWGKGEMAGRIDEGAKEKRRGGKG